MQSCKTFVGASGNAATRQFSQVLGSAFRKSEIFVSQLMDGIK